MKPPPFVREPETLPPNTIFDPSHENKSWLYCWECHSLQTLKALETLKKKKWGNYMQSGVAYVCSVAEYTSLIYFLTKYLLLHIWGFKQT